MWRYSVIMPGEWGHTLGLEQHWLQRGGLFERTPRGPTAFAYSSCPITGSLLAGLPTPQTIKNNLVAMSDPDAEPEIRWIKYAISWGHRFHPRSFRDLFSWSLTYLYTSQRTTKNHPSACEEWVCEEPVQTYFFHQRVATVHFVLSFPRRYICPGSCLLSTSKYIITTDRTLAPVENRMERRQTQTECSEWPNPMRIIGVINVVLKLYKYTFSFNRVPENA